jgi:hypothetical protein
LPSDQTHGQVPLHHGDGAKGLHLLGMLLQAVDEERVRLDEFRLELRPQPQARTAIAKVVQGNPSPGQPERGRRR